MNPSPLAQPLTAEQIHQKLAERFPAPEAGVPGPIGPLQPPNKDAFCTVAPARLVEVCRFLKTEPSLGFDFLQDLTATDHPKENQLRMVYHLYSYRHRHGFVLKAELDRQQPQVDTLEGVWKAANWLEREVFDLFGVQFQGHPDLRRIMLPDDWVGHPLRKDYVEAGGYHGIENTRENPLTLLLAHDKAVRAAMAPPPPPAAPPPAPPAGAAPAAPAAPKEGA